MTTDYFVANKQWVENNHLFTFDDADTERVDLAALGMPLSEILFVAWMRSIRKDLIKTNLSIIAGFEGRHRSGKSLAACTWGYILDPTFWDRFEHRIVKTPQELMTEIRNIRDADIHGAVIIIDEGGVVVPNDEYFSEWYKELSRVFQMFGYLNPCIFFCALNRESIGAKFRKLFNFIISAKRKSKEYSKLNCYELSYNPMFRKYMHKRPKFQIAGQDVTLKGIQFGKPPEFIIERYKNLSTLQKNEYLDASEERMTALAKPKAKKAVTNYEEIIQYLVKNSSLYATKNSRPNRVILDAFKIHIKHAIKNQDAQYCKKEAEAILNERNDGQAIPE